MTIITQQYIDDLILWVADKKTDLAGIVCDHIINSDPASADLMLRLMMVQVLQTTIRHYDITWDIFTQDQLLRVEEDIRSVLQTCPNYK